MRLLVVSSVVFALACTGGQTELDAGMNSCPVATGTGTMHNATVTADTTWKATDNPHVVTFGFIVEKTATLTFEPCTEVKIQGGHGITVRGKLVAEGTATTPIRVTADDAAKPWSYIQLMGGSASLAYVTLENGGSTADVNGLATLEARGQAFEPRQEVLKVNHVSIKGSKQFGVSLRDGATFTADSTALTISGAALGPIRTWPRLAGNIPSGSYTGNTLDEISVMAENDLTENTTLRERGVPYRLGTGTAGRDLRVGSTALTATRSTLTVEPGVTVRVVPGGRILMTKGATMTTGVLVAEGTAAKPIVFTSAAATPAAGDWVGLWFDGPDSANKLDFVEVKYAGGPTTANGFHCEPTPPGGFSKQEDAAILAFGKPPAAFITHSTITASGGDGIGRSWSGDALDLSATNTFSQLKGCKQSLPRDALGACPATVPCEK